MFHSATVKLTGIYVGILLTICLLFSGLLYQVLAAQLNRNYNMQADFFAGRARFQDFVRDPEAVRFLDDQLANGKQRVLLELLYINIAIVLTGGIASYFLARKTIEPIEAAHEAQSRFTADASHELRTPLATMQTEIEVALRDPKLKLSEAKDLLTSNLEEISTLRQLTTGLLTLARGNDVLPAGTVTDLKSAVDDALVRTEKMAHKKNVTITANVPKKLVAQADRTHLTEILVILIDNAIKYSDPKQTVEVSADQSEGHITVSVADSGIGISAESLEHVFNRFYRADNARSQSGRNGHGLGLAIAKQLTEQSGGSIEITSQPDKGTTASVILRTT